MNAAKKTARFTVEIPRSERAGSLIQRWSERQGVALRIVRGRVSPELSRFELELQGTVHQISRIVRQSLRWKPAPSLPSRGEAGESLA